MDAVVGFVETIVNMGAFVMMPAILFIMGLVFGMKVKDALRAGIVVGIGFKGISLTSSLISGTMTPLVQKLQELWGLSLSAVDVGVPVVSAIAFSDGTFVIVMFAVLLLVNIGLLLLKVTKTLNVDIWNFLALSVHRYVCYCYLWQHVDWCPARYDLLGLQPFACRSQPGAHLRGLW